VPSTTGRSFDVSPTQLTKDKTPTKGIDNLNIWRMQKLKVATHSSGLNKQKPQYLSRGWDNRWLTATELCDWISRGKAWAGTHFADGHRTQDNASGSNCIVFDFDGELQLVDFWATTTAQQWCCLTYTSFSSTAEVNRFRAVFPLAGIPLTSAHEHKAVYRFIADKLSNELGITFKDDCGEKPERLWYGNTHSETHLNDGAVVPASVVQAIEIPPEPTYEYTSETTDLDVLRCQWLLAHFIPPSEDGEYNDVYVRVTAACASIGEVMVQAWQEWVSRGHHGDTPSNLDPQRKWRGLGQRSGPSSLYAMAKRIDLNWRRALPPELRYSRGSRDDQVIFERFLSDRMCAPRSMFRST